MTEKRQGLSKSLKTFFGVGDFGFNMMANIDTFYASYYFTDIAKFSVPVMTVMTTISAIVDAILSCLYGPFLNKIKPQKWGRYRSWLILTPWMAPILYAMQFIRIGNGIAAAVIVTIAMITSRIAWNIPFIANLSMINIAAKTPEERMSLSSTRSVWTSLSSMLYSYVGPAVVSIFASMIGEKNSYAATAFSFALLMAAGYYAHFRMFKGYEMTGAEEIALMERKKFTSGKDAPKIKTMDVIFKNSHLMWLVLSSMMKYSAMFLVNGFAMYYFTYVSKDKGLMSTFLFVAYLLGILASYTSRFIVGKLTAKRTVILACIIMATLGAVAYVFYNNLYIVMACMCSLMFMLTLTNSCEPELFSKCAIYSSKKLGYDVTGIVMGLLTVPLKVGIVMRGLLIGAFLALANYSSNIDPAAATIELQRGISLGFTMAPALILLVGGIALMAGYKLENE